MQIFVYLTRRRNITRIYTLSETDTDVLKGWSAAFIANDKETKWIAKSNIASSPSTRGNGCSFCTLAAEKKRLYYAISVLLSPLLSLLSFLFQFSSSSHSKCDISTIYLPFGFHWPMTHNVPICFKYFIYAVPRTYTFWSKKQYSLLSAYGAHFAGTISSEKAVTQYMRLWQGIM